ncbi:MAG: hypothetical protein OEV87_02825 [Phycisphaerae bacterium]|nr:hypothetical protein [Phycisphaerae bacterium]
MRKWLSSCVKEQPEVRNALSDSVKLILEYQDAANPSAYSEPGRRFLSTELTWFRPGWVLFIIISAVTGILFSWLMPSYDKAGEWAILAVRITIPTFTIGLSLVALSRTISESGRFAGEYLNDACKTRLFCCLTLVAVLCGLVGRFLSTIEWVPNFLTVGICAISIGTSVNSLAMLAFVILETIRCSIPSELIKVVSRYAARKLTYGFVNDSYFKLFRCQYGVYLEKWCVGRNIHPPSQYYGHYFKSSLYSGNGDNDVKIELDGSEKGQDVYKDYDLKRLAKLDKYLKKKKAELYLSSPDYESEQKGLGVLSYTNTKQHEEIRSEVYRKGRKVIKWRKYKYLENDDDFWDSQVSKLDEAIKLAIEKKDPIQVKAYLDAVNVPLTVLRQVRKRHKVVRDAYGEYVRRAYQLLSLYLNALEMPYKVRESIWEEAKKILQEMDYHTMELYTWLVQRIYNFIEDNSEDLHEMRGQFGGFYEFASGWLEKSDVKETEDINKMRLVLHKGLTEWILVAIEKNDEELVEQLCEAGKNIVFGEE